MKSLIAVAALLFTTPATSIPPPALLSVLTLSTELPRPVMKSPRLPIPRIVPFITLRLRGLGVPSG